MQRLILAILLLAALAGGSMYFQGYDLTQLGLPKLRTSDAPPPAVQTGPTIKIATFNIQIFGKTKANKPNILSQLADIVRQFDLVAVQEIKDKTNSTPPKFGSVPDVDIALCNGF